MARSRMIKPEFWDDEKLAKVSRDARLTYIGLWNFCDDYGTTKANSLWLKSRIFPFDEKIALKDFERWISELIEIKRIFKFSENGDNFYYLPNFLKHQVINRPSKTRYPEPSVEILSYSLKAHGVLTDEVEVELEREKKEKEKEKASQADIDFEKFYNSYPKKVGRIKAENVWKKTKSKMPPIEKIISKIEELKKSDQWTKDGGEFIPHPATWLNRGGWDDEVSHKRVKAPTWGDYDKSLAESKLKQE
jgi:hypothetical protein